MFLLGRVFFYQFIDKINCCHKKLNYYDELDKTINQLRKINNEKVYRKTNDIGTLFRPNDKKNNGFSLDNLKGIIHFDPENKWIEVGGKTRYYDILKFTLQHNLMPKIVPELSSITVGGAICGISIESSSFKYGWGHDSVLDMDILTASGDLLFCTKDNENKELFNAIPNSYGTLGYVTRAKIELIESKKYVKLVNHKFNNSKDAFAFLQLSVYNNDADFIDAVAYSSYNIVVVLGFLCDNLDHHDQKYVSDYPKNGVYYESIKQLRYDSLTIYDYIWRWDADMFWGVTGVPILKNKWFRWIFGRCMLNTRVLRAMQKVFNGFKKKNPNKEKIVQDLGIPSENAVEFFDWICNTIDKYPIWICPVVPNKMDSPFWTFNKHKLYYDIGVFRSKTHNYTDKHYNKWIEKKLLELDGNKCFYSDTFLSEENFDKLIDPEKYDYLKEKYDPNNIFGDLYEKVVTTS
tara:strand:+ start:618 stop:2003 length:1386 start_codon:yes stop_codon:yes gene_type:complete